MRRAPLRTLLNTSEMLVVINPDLRPPSCERAHIWKGIASSHCSASELILPIVFICLLNLRSVLAKAALHTKFFKMLFIYLLNLCFVLAKVALHTKFIFELGHKIACKMTHANPVIGRWCSLTKMRIGHCCHDT